MNFVEIIDKKRVGMELSREEIAFFIDGVTTQALPDYQISSMLMAICINGMTESETFELTDAMLHSGQILDLSAISGVKLDKHSTGGIADTTTLVLAPLIASFGLPVMKMSGRGLGFTGGTIDKLESIPGFNTEIEYNKAVELVNSNGIVVIGQTAELAPADKYLYALRDVTATINSLPLIASSIMSKKLAAGTDGIVLDIKCGRGAFMKTRQDAVALGELMLKIGKNAGKRVRAIVSDMNQPLGRNIGNALEVIEAVEILKGNTKGELYTVALTLAAHMLVLGEKADNIETAFKMLEENIANKKALDKMAEFVKGQGGNPDFIDDYKLLPTASCSLELVAKRSGYVSKMEADLIGYASIETGAGRKTKADTLDFGAGIVINKKIGEYAESGELLATVYSSDEDRCKKAVAALEKAIILSDECPQELPLIIETLI